MSLRLRQRETIRASGVSARVDFQTGNPDQPRLIGLGEAVEEARPETVARVDEMNLWLLQLGPQIFSDRAALQRPSRQWNAAGPAGEGDAVVRHHTIAAGNASCRPS